ncbi:MAG: RNA polymerase sigma factor [Terriglobia bacterium]
MPSPLDQPPDEVRWIKAAQRGDRESFGRLVERYQRRVLAHVARLVRRRDDVEDIAQEVFIKVFRALRTYNFESSFAAWLSRVTVNHCYDYLRRERASRIDIDWQAPDGEPEGFDRRVDRAEEQSPDPEKQAALRDLVNKLLDRAPAEDRIVLGLKELEGMSVEEIAEILDLNVSTVKVRLHRARKRMLADFRSLAGGK